MQKSIQAWSWVPVVPAAWEDEAELFEPGGVEVAVSQDHATALQSGQQRKNKYI